MIHTVKTRFGHVAVEETQGNGIPVILLHGNSSCKEVFKNQLIAIGNHYHIIAVDLPGHGQSENALDPMRTYTIPGYADVITEVAEVLNLGKFAIFGWSLGGHIAIELISRGNLAGIAICGTPPIRRGGIAMLLGYKLTKLSFLIGQNKLTKQQVYSFAEALYGRSLETQLVEAVKRTHGLARSIMLDGVKSCLGVDQRKMVETSDVPLAIINGDNDRFIRQSYIKSAKYKNLWREKVHLIAQSQHAPFLQNPAEFNTVLNQFLSRISENNNNNTH